MNAGPARRHRDPSTPGAPLLAAELGASTRSGRRAARAPIARHWGVDPDLEISKNAGRADPLRGRLSRRAGSTDLDVSAGDPPRTVEADRHRRRLRPQVFYATFVPSAGAAMSRCRADAGPPASADALSKHVGQARNLVAIEGRPRCAARVPNDGMMSTEACARRWHLITPRTGELSDAPSNR